MHDLREETGVTDGARTHDNRNHNPGLYQLSYSHRRYCELPGCRVLATLPFAVLPERAAAAKKCILANFLRLGKAEPDLPSKVLQWSRLGPE